MNKIIGNVKETTLIIFFMLLLYIKIISFNFNASLFQYTNGYLIIGIFGSVFILSSVLLLFKGKARVKAFIILNMLVTLIILTDVVYNRYFQDVTSVALIHQVRIAGEVNDSIKALVRLTDFLYFFDIVIMSALYFVYKKRISFDENLGKKTRVALISIFFISGMMLTGVSVKALEKEQPGLLKTFYDKKYIVSRVGDLNFHAYDLYRYISNRVFNMNRISDKEKESVKTWIETKNQTNKKNYSELMKNKNLIVVQLEAFQGFVLNGKVEGQEITPNLNKLAKESLVFNNYYYQTAWGGTSDAEFLSNVSLLPAREGSVYYQYSGNTYESIVSQLKEKGYYTTVMHANRPGFWNRTNMYASLGFDKYESEKDFVIDEKQGLGLSDKSFFRQASTKMQSLKSPFYSFLITLSSHFPYKDQDNKIKDIINVGKFEGTVMGDYIKSVKYTDEAIGQCIDELKKSGLWDNSVVVFYGDHSAIPLDQKKLLAQFVYGRDDMTSLEWFKEQRVVGMIHFPGQELKGKVTKPAGQMDLFPTLANLLGVDAKYAMGQDILNSEKGFVVLRDGNWIYGNSVYLKSEDKVYDINTGQEQPKQEYEEQFKRADKYLENSDAIVENDLIKYFKDR